MSKVYKIKIHSLVDMITNSSTVIYTYSDGSIDTCKKMMNEILSSLGNPLTCDDMFYIYTHIDYDIIIDHMTELDDEDVPEGYKDLSYNEQSEFLDEYLSKIAEGSIAKPTWLSNLESKTDYDGFSAQTYLSILPKDTKYEQAAAAIVKFLYSTSHEATYG